MSRRIIPYNSSLKGIARELRNNSKPGEILLWKQLRKRQMPGFDFHRQRPIDQFIVDFFCHELWLAVEIDGGCHETEEAKLKTRRGKSAWNPWE